MKKILLALFTITSTLSISSCSDFLNSDSQSTYLPEVVFSSTSNANKSVMGIYSTLVVDRTYGQTLAVSNFNGSDTELQKFTIGSPAQGDARAMGNYLDNPGIAFNKDIWSNLYKAIEYANQVVYGVENSHLYLSGTTAEKNLMKSYRAEAKVLRAWCYMELARNFGDIPLRKSPTMTEGSELYKPKTPIMDVYAWLVEDLKGVGEDLPWKNGTTFERVGRGFTKGLRARLALYRGGYYFTTDKSWKRMDDWQDYYQIAKDETGAIISDGIHNLDPNYRNVFYQQCQLKPAVNNESLFEIGMALGRSSEIGHLTGIPFAAASKYVNPSSGNSIQTITPISFLYSFDKADNRRDVSVAYYSYDSKSKMVVKTNPTDFSIAKWSIKLMTQQYWDSKAGVGSNKLTTGINFVAMRYSDVLLMYAEAENAINGPTTLATDQLYKVRNRAFGGNLSRATFDTYLASKGDLQLAIEDERMWEFAGEGIRKYDLIRWNKLATKLIQMKENIAKIVIDRVNPYDNDAPIPSTLMYKYKTTDAEDIDLSLSMIYTPTVIGDDGKPVIPSGYLNTDWAKKPESIDGYITELVGGLVHGTTILNNGRPYRPLHSSIISDSQNMLKNDYGY